MADTSIPVEEMAQKNPYIGPFPFEEKDLKYFFGRENEIAILEGLVLASRVTLFFAQSGAGKSSLLRAGLIPSLTRQETRGRDERQRLFQKMQLLPIVRVGGDADARIAEDIPNIFVFHTLAKLLSPTDKERTRTGSLIDGLNAWQDATLVDSAAFSSPHAFQLATNKRANATLLIFDQFEELFTRYPERWQDREDFFRQVVDALNQFPFLHILFSMREDYIAELTPYAQLLPDELRHRFRMERMTRTAALLAVREPARIEQRPFAQGVAETLVDNLARIQSAQHKNPATQTEALPTTQPAIGDSVEPVHLQIVCQQLWTKLPVAGGEIRREDVQDFGDVDQALAGFYEDKLHAVCAETGHSERHLRDWFSQELITPSRMRGLLYQDANSGFTEKLPNSVVDALRDAYLIRPMLRGGEIWIELAHDRLIEPILNANQTWLRTFANPLREPTQQWLASGKAEQALLRGELLHAANQFAKIHKFDLLEDENDLLALSLKSVQQQRERVQQRRTLILSSVGTGIILLSLIIYSAINRSRIQAAERENLSIQIAQAAQKQYAASQFDVALILATQAVTTSPSVEAISSLHTIFAQPGYQLRQLDGHSDKINRILWSSDGKRLMTASNDGTVRIWDDERGEEMLHFSHRNPVNDVAWNSDETMFFARTSGGELYLWEAANDSQPLSVITDTRAFNDAQWSPDDRRIAAATQSGGVQIWTELLTQKPQKVAAYSLFSNTVTVDWSQDGQFLLTAGYGQEVDSLQLLRVGSIDGIDTNPASIVSPMKDAAKIAAMNWSPNQVFALVKNFPSQTVTLWDVPNGTLLKRIEGFSGSIRTVAWRPDSTQFLVADTAGYVQIYDPTAISQTGTADVVMRLYNPSGYVAQAFWDREQKRIFLAGNKGSVTVWDAKSGVLLLPLARPAAEGATPHISLSPVSNTLAIGTPEGMVELWSLDSLDELPTLRGHTDFVRAALPNSDKSTLMTYGADGWLNLWNLTENQLRHTFKVDNDIENAKWMPNGQQILAAGGDGNVYLWDANTDAEVARFATGDDSVTYAKLLPRNNRTYIYTGSSRVITQGETSFFIRLWDVEAPVQPILSLPAQSGVVETVRWSNDGTRIATASTAGWVRIWSAIDGSLIREFPHNQGLETSKLQDVKWAEWIRNDLHLLTWSRDGTARLWNTKTWQPVTTMQHNSPILHAEWNNAQSRLLTGCEDGSIRLWNLYTGELIARYDGHTSAISLLSWSQDESNILSADQDGFVRIWDATTNKALRSFFGHAGGITSAVWNKDETQLLTTSEDGTARIWDVEEGKGLTELRGHSGGVRGGMWLENDRIVLTYGSDGSVRRYYTAASDLLTLACQRMVRNLSQEEWDRFIGNGQRQKTCPHLP